MKGKNAEKLERWREVFYSIRVHALKHAQRNTLIALRLAKELHEGTFRDGGEPYVIHPLMVAKTLNLLKLEEEFSKWYPHMGEDEIRYQCDVIYSSALLHDVLEDCDVTSEKLLRYGLDEEIIDIIKLLTKKKKGSSVKKNEDEYFSGILSNRNALLVKIADRENNCSTLEVFEEQRMKNYIKETQKYFYPICSEARDLYPEISRVVTIMKNSIVSICEVIAVLLNMQDVIADEDNNYQRTVNFIEEYSRSKMPNTHKALYLAQKLHKGQTRFSGDPFIIHPLRVCSYLISLGIDDDILCAAMLLHEVPKMCKLKNNGKEFVQEYDIDKKVVDLVLKIPKKDGVSLDEYYKNLKSDWRAILGRLSNRAHTCTGLARLSSVEKKEYIMETRERLVPMCNYATNLYPQYVAQIDIMRSHILTICNIVEALTSEEEAE